MRAEVASEMMEENHAVFMSGITPKLLYETAHVCYHLVLLHKLNKTHSRKRNPHMLAMVL